MAGVHRDYRMCAANVARDINIYMIDLHRATSGAPNVAKRDRACEGLIGACGATRDPAFAAHPRRAERLEYIRVTLATR